MVVRNHGKCRVCDTKLGKPYLDLGVQPLANQLVGPILRPDEPLVLDSRPALLSAPLAVTLCKKCGLSQLTVVVDPQVLYNGYRFRSGTSAKWVAHCEQLAFAASLQRVGRMLDIAANDGTCMKAFAAKGWDVHGVDPEPCAENITKGLWPFVNVPGPFDLIVAQNVLGHVDRVIPFLQGCESALAAGGRLCIEVPHIRDLLRSGTFDTIYHEHLSYWNARSLRHAARAAGLTVAHTVNLPEIHGGSRRYWLTRDYGQRAKYQPADGDVLDLPYGEFAAAVDLKLELTRLELERIQSEGKRLWAYGASAKGAVMLNALKAKGNTVWPEYILDDEPAKQGMYSPGLHLPIVAPPAVDWDVNARSSWDACDVLWLLSWNNADGLKAKARAAGFTGQFLVTHPTLCRST